MNTAKNLNVLEIGLGSGLVDDWDELGRLVTPEDEDDALIDRLSSDDDLVDDLSKHWVPECYMLLQYLGLFGLESETTVEPKDATVLGEVKGPGLW